MKTQRTIVLTALMALVVGACGTAASPSPSAPASVAPTAAASPSASAEASASTAPASPTPLPADPAEAVIQGVEPSADHRRSGRSTCRPRSTSTSRTRSPGSRRRIRASTVTWHDHQGTFKDDLNNCVRRGQRAGRHQPLGQRGLGQRVRGQGPAAGPRHPRPAGRQGHLLPGPLEAAARRRRELPVPVVPGPQRRADQQGHLREGRRRPRRLPEDARRAARPCARPSSTRPARVAPSA